MEKSIDNNMTDNIKENDIKLLIEKLSKTHSLSLEEYRQLIEGLEKRKTGDGSLSCLAFQRIRQRTVPCLIPCLIRRAYEGHSSD